MFAAVLQSLPHGGDSALAEARLTLDPLHLEPVVVVQSRGQWLVLPLAKCPSQAEVDVLHDYGWHLLAGGKPHL